METHHRQPVLERGSDVIVNGSGNAFDAATASKASAIRKNRGHCQQTASYSHTIHVRRAQIAAHLGEARRSVRRCGDVVVVVETKGHSLFTYRISGRAAHREREHSLVEARSLPARFRKHTYSSNAINEDLARGGNQHEMTLALDDEAGRGGNSLVHRCVNQREGHTGAAFRPSCPCHRVRGSCRRLCQYGVSDQRDHHAEGSLEASCVAAENN